MKNSLQLLTALVAVSFPCVALAEVAGVHLTASLSFETMIGLYTAALIGLTLVSDYSRRAPSLKTPVEAFRTLRATEAHRLAA
jgi:hypothetical protein